MDLTHVDQVTQDMSNKLAPLSEEAQAVLDTRAAAEIEKEMVEREQKAINDRVNGMSAADISAVFFNQFYPQYAAKVSTLSNKEARRLADALVQWPLIDENPRFSSQAGKEAFSIGMRLIDAKTIMRDTIELEQMQKDVDKEKEMADNKVEEILQNVETEYSKENENG